MTFKIGDIVMRLDGDGRPHKIADISFTDDFITRFTNYVKGE